MNICKKQRTEHHFNISQAEPTGAIHKHTALWSPKQRQVEHLKHLHTKPVEKSIVATHYFHITGDRNNRQNIRILHYTSSAQYLKNIDCCCSEVGHFYSRVHGSTFGWRPEVFRGSCTVSSRQNRNCLWTQQDWNAAVAVEVQTIPTCTLCIFALSMPLSVSNRVHEDHNKIK
jgi:hypothetical protein